VIPERDQRTLGAERLIGRVLIAITYFSVALLLVGVGLMLRAGISPVAGGPGLDLEALGSEVVALGPAGVLWLGLLAVIAAPISRVLLAGVAYARDGDWAMVGVAFAILSVIVVGVATAGAATV
jgi:uncharacterized membrane protein